MQITNSTTKARRVRTSQKVFQRYSFVSFVSFVVAIVGGVLPPVSGRQALSADERALGTYIDAHTDDAIALLERVVNINSGTQNLDGVKPLARYFARSSIALGFKTEWVDGAAWQRAGHLVATHAATGPKLLLIGHLDTVFERDSPFQKFERVDARHRARSRHHRHEGRRRHHRAGAESARTPPAASTR